MDKNYNSVYGSYIKQFIEMKRALGFKYSTDAIILCQIDRFAEQSEETSIGITKKFATSWGKKRLHESDIYRYGRIRILAHFSSYLLDLGIQSYIPKLPPYHKSTFIPYIFSRNEIDAIFKACDELRLEIVNLNANIFCMPTLLRLLYATGIRISEALALKDEDVNLNDFFLRIKDCKNGKERIIPISSSLASVCKKYVRYRNQLPLGKIKSGYFFVKLNGNKCGASTRDWFKKCLEKANVTCISHNQRPRIHDLRHTFAVTSLANMADAGIDLYVSLPILSTYLGHQSLEATNHYVRLTTSMYPDLIKDVDMLCLDVFPKIKSYETY
ncbi:MAG: tyrosine-type recombinase/integrase [Bacteroidetes bacterium]|nr:tyrosine-type recombinase/integrase [Bacteroidota bacterium]